MVNSVDTLPRLLQRNAIQYANKDAIREKKFGIWQTFTWSEYETEVQRLAHGLTELGFRRGDRLAVIGDNRPRLYWAILATQALGGVATAAYQDSIAKEMGYVLSHSEVKIILAENEEQVDKLYEVREESPTVQRVIYDDPRGLEFNDDKWLIDYDKVIEQGRAHQQAHPGFYDDELARGGLDDVALICYTSGTAGDPKGVMLTHRNLTTAVREGVISEDWRHTDEVMAYLPIAWVGDTAVSVAGAMICGMAVSCPESPETVLRDYREIGPTVVLAPPRTWENLLTRIQVRMEEAGSAKKWLFEWSMNIALRVESEVKDGRRPPLPLRILNQIGDFLVRAPLRDLLGLRRIRLGYTGGAPLGPDVFDYLRALGIKLKQLYGLTESSAACCFQPDGEARSDTVGRPLTGVEIKIDDNGEILLKGDMNFKGYFKNEQATRETFVEDGWMKTGDAGFIDESGHLKVIDRAKDVNRLRDGTLFAPQFLENKLKFSPYIKEAVTIGVDREYVAAMINIDMDTMENWAERNSINYSGYRELAQREESYRLIQNETAKINHSLAQDREMAGAQVRRFLILYKELDADDGEITRTRKIRRGLIGERYKPLIEALYSEAESVDVEIPVTYEDGRTAVLNASVRLMEAPVRTSAEPQPAPQAISA